MRISNKLIAAGLAFAVTAMVAGPALAAEATVGLDLNSAYVWRGITFNDGLVAQPSLDVAHESGLGFNVWGNMDLDDYDGALEDGEFSEVDLTVSYAVPVEQVGVTVGYIEYLFPATSPTSGVLGTRELTLDVGYDLGQASESLKGLGVGLFLAYDVDEIDDIYGNLYASYGFEVTEEFSMEAGALVGYAGTDFAQAYGGTDSGFSEWQLSLSGAYALNEATELGAFIAYTDAVDDDVLPEQDVDVYGGVSVYYGF